MTGAVRDKQRLAAGCVRHLLALTLAMATLLTAVPAAASCALNAETAGYTLTLQLPPALIADFDRRVQTGVTVRLVHVVRLDDEAAGEAATLRFGCDIVYDPWSEAYEVKALATIGTPRNHAAGALAPRSDPHLSGNLHIPGAKLTLIPPPCDHLAIEAGVHQGATFDVLTQLDPVSDEEVQATRHWLAERGVGMAAPSLIGRAVAALIDLKGGRAAEAHCALPPPAPGQRLPSDRLPKAPTGKGTAPDAPAPKAPR